VRAREPTHPNLSIYTSYTLRSLLLSHMSPGIVRIRLDKRDYSTSCAREQLSAGPGQISFAAARSRRGE